MSRGRALIAGAGIGGLAAGVALHRAGWSVRIFERAPSARELGFALALAPNAIAALEELGLSREIVATGVTGGCFEVRHLDGRLIRRFSAPPGSLGVVALRSALHGQLLAAVPQSSLVFGSEVVAFIADGDGVTLKLGDGRVERGDLLVGADGVGSAIRKQLHPDERAAIRSGFHGLRGLARGVCGRLGDLGAVGYFDDGIEAAAVRAADDAVYWYFSLLSADLPIGSEAPAQIVRRLLAGADSLLRGIVEATEPGEMRLDELLVRSPLRQWGAGRVTLLGDAAHPVLPHTGQGAAQALEDAVALGLALRASGDAAGALRQYERVRSRRTRRLIALGPRIARMTTTRSRVRKLARMVLLRAVPGWLVLRAARPVDPHVELRRARS